MSVYLLKAMFKTYAFYAYNLFSTVNGGHLVINLRILSLSFNLKVMKRLVSMFCTATKVALLWSIASVNMRRNEGTGAIFTALLCMAAGLSPLTTWTTTDAESVTKKINCKYSTFGIPSTSYSCRDRFCGS